MSEGACVCPQGEGPTLSQQRANDSERVCIGFRAFTDGFAFVALAGSQRQPTVVASERFSFPKGKSWPECLAWLRRQLGEIMQSVRAGAASIKGIEGNSRTKSSERIQIEGVITEFLFSELGIVCVTRVKSQLRRDIKGFDGSARYLSRVLQGADALSQLNTQNFQEATLAALSELPY
jgi:hypothetical protein